jgi:DNA-binding NarL/FixJ family response regulator
VTDRQPPAQTAFAARRDSEPPRTRILFVDDEPLVLDALRDVLRANRGKWDMHFLASGVQALRQLDMEPVDVVVTDIRMVGMSGPTLLLEVSRRWPSATRIILSGTRGALRRDVVQIAHAVLTKPCDPAALEQAINLARC